MASLKGSGGRRKPSLGPLGESEMELLHLIWEMGPSTVAEIHERVLARRRVAYTTVMSQLRKLADKGYLTFEQNGNAYVYQSARKPQEVRFSLLSGILTKVFNGSAVDLVANLVRHEKLSEGELDEIRRIVAPTPSDAADESGTGRSDVGERSDLGTRVRRPRRK